MRTLKSSNKQTNSKSIGGMVKVWKNDINNPRRGKSEMTQSERSLLLGITDIRCPT